MPCPSGEADSQTISSDGLRCACPPRLVARSTDAPSLVNGPRATCGGTLSPPTPIRLRRAAAGGTQSGGDGGDGGDGDGSETTQVQGGGKTPRAQGSGESQAGLSRVARGRLNLDLPTPEATADRLYERSPKTPKMAEEPFPFFFVLERTLPCAIPLVILEGQEGIPL